MRSLAAAVVLALALPSTPAPQAATPTLAYVTLAPPDFVVLTTPPRGRWGLAPQTGRAHLEGAGKVEILASVHLPVGARIERLACWYEDSDPKGDLELHGELYRSSFDAADFELVAAVNIDTRGAPGRAKDESKSLASSPVGPLHRHHLHVLYRQTSETSSGAATLAFDGCRVTFALP